MKEKESEPMSQWEFNNFETEIDFTDADFMEKFEGCYEKMAEESEKVPKVGKVSEITRAQCKVFDDFYDRLFGNGTSGKMFLGKNSMDMRVKAANSLFDLRNSEQSRYNSIPHRGRSKSRMLPDITSWH